MILVKTIMPLGSTCNVRAMYVHVLVNDIEKLYEYYIFIYTTVNIASLSVIEQLLPFLAQIHNMC